MTALEPQTLDHTHVTVDRLRVGWPYINDPESHITEFTLVYGY